MNRTLLILTVALLASSLSAISITADITTDTTWTSSDSPVIINPAGSSGGTITVRNGATLTIDSSSGNVLVQWNENCDLRIGNGSEQGTLALKASSGGTITFEVRTGGNIAISSTGQIVSIDDTTTVAFTRFSTNQWGALDFEAGQTRQSYFSNCTFSYGGNDSGAHNGLIHVRDSASNLPKLHDVSFDNCTVAAMRLDGEGINTLAEGNITGSFAVTNTTYVLNLQTTTSTAPNIRFPDVANNTAPLAQFTGNQTLGSSTKVSHWRFDDAWEFVEITGTPAVVIVQGSIWGSAQVRPVFRTTSGTSKSAWTGIQITTDTYPNVFGGDGPLGFVEIRNASVGLDINKGTTYLPDASGPTPWRFPGLVVRMCGIGVQVRTALETDAPFEGYTTIIESADIGGVDSSSECTTSIQVDHGRAVIKDSLLQGATAANLTVGSGTSEANDVTVTGCRLSDTAATNSVNLANCAAAGTVTIERTSIFSATTGILVTQTSGTPTRAVIIRHSCITALTTCLSLNLTTDTVATLLVEDSTIGGTSSGTTQRGILATEMKSSGTAIFRRCNIMNNRDNGFQTATGSGNTCEYTFDQCAFLTNGDGGTGEGGIRDSRTNSARVVALHCTFQGNNPNGVYDNNGTAVTLAENCYWGASNGPGGSGPGSGDAIATSTSNVDASPFLARPYFDFLIGGSPASASEWNVQEDATTPADALHVIASAPYFAWVFASDFANETQSAYRIQVSSSPTFGSTVWDTTKTASTSASNIQYAGSSLTAGTLYYARIMLWNQNDRQGPWRTLTFRRNTTPPAVGNTSRLPANTASIGDWTPVLQWQRPTDADEDPLHFEVSVTNGGTTYTVRSWALSSDGSPAQIDARGQFEMSSDDGTTWVPLPSDGAPAGAATLVRLTWPTQFALSDDTWEWEVYAYDGFATSSASDTWSIDLTRTYTFNGQLFGTGVSSKVIRIVRNNTILTTSPANPATDGSGNFTFSVTDDLVYGEALSVFVDGDTNKGATIFQFAGQDMTEASGLHRTIDIEFHKMMFDQRIPGLPLNTMPTWGHAGVDADIPWSWSPGLGQVFPAASIAGSGNGVAIRGHVQVTEAFNCQTNDVELTVWDGANLQVSASTLYLHKLNGNGRVTATASGHILLDGANSYVNGGFTLHDSTFEFNGGSSLQLRISAGVLDAKNATFLDGTANVSELLIDSTSVSAPAVLCCINSVFDEVRLVVEDDGAVALFDDNTFQNDVSSRHIHWKSTSLLSTGRMRGIQFNTTLNGSSTFNIRAETSALSIYMIGCGGIGTGEDYEDDSGNKVNWELIPPTGLSVIVGDTRLRLEWEASSQTGLSGAGYNVYRTTNPADSLPWGSPLNGGTPVTNTFYNDTSLSNGTTYYYYVTFIDTNPAVDVESGGSNRASAAPGAASIDSVVPEETAATSIVAMTAFGVKTHWDGTTTVTIAEKLGGTGGTLNDWIVISPTLILADVTFSGATPSATWAFSATTNDVWGIGAYDEGVGKAFTVTANVDLTNRPTLSFTNPSADGDTSGGFTIGLSYSANGGAAINTATLELMASRDVTVQSVNRVVGTNLAQIGSFWDTLNSTTATCNVGQTGATELFANGEYTLSARIGNNNGLFSEWQTLRFYVEGAGTDVVKCSTLLLQGSTQNVTLTGTSLSSSQTISFGSGITVNSASGSGSSITVNVTVSQLAACGPRAITTNNGAKAGIAIVEYPTNILPTTTNDEPSRNPGIGGVNVFLVNGAFFKSETDLAVRGRMMGISWSRFYRSDIGYNGPLGHGWVGHYYQRAVFDSGSSDIQWYTPDGRKEVFPDVTGGFSSPVGVYVRATRETTYNTITLTDRHGYRCVFNADGRLWRCIDRNGNTTECSYNYAGQLTTIANDLGETFSVTYGTDGRVETVADNMWNDGSSGHTSAREVEYTYDSNGDLIEQAAPETSRYNDADSNRITYAYRYDAQHRLTHCINPREVAESGNPVAYLQNFYDDQGRVTDQQLGNEGDVVDGQLARSAFIRLRYTVDVDGNDLVREIDRRGLRTDYTLDSSGRVTKAQRFTAFWSVDTQAPIDHSAKTEEVAALRGGDPESFNTTFTYNSNHEVLTITYPRGNKVTHTYPSASAGASGTATSCSGATLTDSGASFGALTGQTLRMGANAGNYRYYPIASNTGTTITVATGFSLSGDGWNADAYAIFTQAADHLAAGNVLTVTRSDEGLGSLSDIVVNYTYEPRYQFVKTVSDPRDPAFITTYTYDYEESAANGADAGNLVKVESPVVTNSMASSSSIITRTSYNEFGQPVTMIDGESNVTRLVYHASGSQKGFLKLRITAWGELDLTSEYAYDPVGNLTASWPPRAFESGATKDDFKAAFVVNELNQTWHVTGPKLTDNSGQRVDSYRYFDPNGNLTHSLREYITAAGSTPSAPGDEDDPGTFTRSSSAMAATWHLTQYRYNLLNYTTETEVDAVAGSAISTLTSRVKYDANYNAVESISPLGNRSRTVLDERDMTFRRVAGAYSDVSGVFETDYDANGNVTASRDARGNQTSYAYDGFDRTIQVTDAASHYRQTDYDAASNVIETRAYDKFGNLLTQSQTTYDEISRAWTSRRLAKNHLGSAIGDGWNTSVSQFDKNSRVVSGTNDNGVTYQTFYDGANRVTRTRDAVGNEARYTYNSNGATTKVDYFEVNGLTSVIEKSHVENLLDYADRVVEHRDRRWSASFDTSGSVTFDYWSRVVTSTDAVGNTTTTNYDLISRVTDRTEEAGTEDIHTIFQYDADSRTTLRGIRRNPTDNNYQQTTYEYDERSRLKTLRRPDGDIWSYQYDANGNQLGWTDPLGTVVVNTYDQRNLISYRNITRGTGIKGATYESYEFDGLGRLTSCSNYENANLISATSWQYNTQSQPERSHQTIAKQDGTIINTWTAGAEFDASGFNSATIYSNGRRMMHERDALDRTLATFDEGGPSETAFTVATYLYAGQGRLIERGAGNGIRTNYTWEASGCGCGGATAFCERVEHVRVSTGEIIAATDRRYDRRGLVTAERRDHNGGMGHVYRYDNASRLTNSYFGVDLYDVTGPDDLAGFADPATTPTVFGLKRAYNLDPRGNRTGSTGVRDSDDASTTIYDTAFTASIDTNQYTAVDGDSYVYDVSEQMTFDPSTGLYHAYDYKGQLVATDNDSDLASPERTYSYDNQGKRKRQTDSYNPEVFDICYVTPCVCDCGCGGNENLPEGVYTHDASNGDVLTVELNVMGVDVESPGSSSAVHPATAAVPSAGRAVGNALIAQWVYNVGENLRFWRFMGHDQHGSLVVVTDRNGYRTDMYVSLDYGHAGREKVYVDFAKSDITSVVHDSPVAGMTTISISGPTGFSTDELAGRELYVSAPDNADRRIRAGHIIANTFTTMIVRDMDADDIASAIWDSGGGAPIRGFCILDFREKPVTEVVFTVTSETFTHGVTIIEHDGDFIGIESGWDIPDIDTGELAIELILPGELHFFGDVTGQFTVFNTYTAVRPGDWTYPTNGGIWTSDADEDSGTTTFTDSNANFESYMVGWTLIPNIEKPNFLIISNVASATEIEVQGNAENLGSIGNIYRLAPAPGCCVTHGTLSEPENQGARTFEDPGTMWLWSGYQYVPPQVGLNISGTAEGEQSGSNKLGNYHCWNRVYDVHVARWTTPDPTGGPASNLFAEDNKPKKKCCCAKDLSIYPADAKTNAELEGKKEIGDHGWSKMVEDMIEAAKKAGEPYTEKEIEAVKKLLYGADGKKLGREDVKTAAGEYVLFKFQSVGEVEWVEWDGNTEPDCTFDQQVTRTNTDGTVVAKKSDFAAANQDPNTDAGGKNASGQYGARVKLSDTKYSWVDPVITDFAPAGTTKRAFEMTLTSAAGCPCKKASVTKKADLEVDTSKKPPSVTWSVK